VYSVSKSEAKVLDLPGRVVNVLIGSEKLSSDRMTVGLTEVPPDTAMTPHCHEDMEEIIYVIEGSGEANVGGSIEKLAPDTAVIFPIGVVHAITNTGRTPMRFVFMFNPPNDFSVVK
jgi:quercetin dioxygenase-like cupin family protein